jgi:hypothetical protein
MLARDENIQSIAAAVGMPLLGVLPYTKVADFDVLATFLRL